MTGGQKACRFVSVLATMLAAAWLIGSFSMIHQGEEDHVVGFAIVWLGKIGAMGLVIAAGLAAVAPKAALKTLVLSTALSAPLVAFFLFPRLWCLLLACGIGFDGVYWEPRALVPVGALALAIGTMRFSRPQ